MIRATPHPALSRGEGERSRPGDPGTRGRCRRRRSCRPGSGSAFASSHLPVPSHMRTGIRSFPLSLQPPTWQMVPAGYTAQSPATSQRPVCWQLAAPLSTHLPRGSWAPPGTGRQRPGVSGNAHDWQAIAQSDSQQTPSTQCPVRHSDPRLHAEEVGLPVVEVGGGSGGGGVGVVGSRRRARRAHHDLDGLHHAARDQHVGGAGADRRAGGERGRLAPHLASVERVRQIDEGVLIAGLERAGVAARRRRIDDDFARRRPRHAQPELVVLQRPEPHVNVRASRLLPAAPDGGRCRDGQHEDDRANVERAATDSAPCAAYAFSQANVEPRGVPRGRVAWPTRRRRSSGYAVATEVTR